MMDALELQKFLLEPTDGTKIQELHRQFAAILHANKCVKQKLTTICTITICSKYRPILAHYSRCKYGLECTYESCSTTRVLFKHFETCVNPSCNFCEPLKKRSKKLTTSSCTKIATHEASPSSSSNYHKVSFCQRTWPEEPGSAREAYFSTYSEGCIQQHDSADVLSGTIFRSRYGKTERIQRELIVMFHVQRCADLEKTQSIERDILCAVPHCPTMKRTLIHIAMCYNENCGFPECEVTRSIIQHWLRCPKYCCDICSPVLDSIPAIDGGSHYEMDDKLLALLYTSTNGLIKIASSDVTSYEEDLEKDMDPLYAEYSTDCFVEYNSKRKHSSDRLNLTFDLSESGWKKKNKN